MAEVITAAQFEALAELLRLRNSPSREAARLVLVDGLAPADAARAVGTSPQAVSNVLSSCRRGFALAQQATQGLSVEVRVPSEKTARALAQAREIRRRLDSNDTSTLADAWRHPVTGVAEDGPARPTWQSLSDVPKADADFLQERTNEEQEWLDAPAVGREVLTPYDPAEYLTSDAAIEVFLADAEKTGDASYIAHAREVAERARAMNRTRAHDR